MQIYNFPTYHQIKKLSQALFSTRKITPHLFQNMKHLEKKNIFAKKNAP